VDDAVVEFFGGPVDGKRVQAVDNGQAPHELRFVVVPAKYASALDDEPSVPAEVHRYRRDSDVPAGGRVWRFRWNGRLD
jgi:hypothetical protein